MSSKWYLLPTVGSGTTTDRFRPKYVQGLEWSSHGRLYFAAIVLVEASDKILADISSRTDVVELPDKLTPEVQDKVAQVILDGAMKAGVAITVDAKEHTSVAALSGAILEFQRTQSRSDRVKIVDTVKGAQDAAPSSDVKPAPVVGQLDGP